MLNLFKNFYLIFITCNIINSVLNNAKVFVCINTNILLAKEIRSFTANNYFVYVINKVTDYLLH